MNNQVYVVTFTIAFLKVERVLESHRPYHHIHFNTWLQRCCQPNEYSPFRQTSSHGSENGIDRSELRAPLIHQVYLINDEVANPWSGTFVVDKMTELVGFRGLRAKQEYLVLPCL